MPPSKWSKYGKKYNKDWEMDTQLKDWIGQVVGDQSKAMCRYCKAWNTLQDFCLDFPLILKSEQVDAS